MRANIRHRAARRWAFLAPAAVAVAVAVTGCGQTQLGAVAIYGNQRITSVKLADEVKNLNVGYQADKSKAQIQYKPGSMPRQVLSWLLRFATVEQMGVRAGIHVTPAQAQAQLAAEAASASRSGNSLAEIAVLNGLPPDLLPELGRWFAIQVQLEKKLDHGVAPKTTAAQTAIGTRINHLQCLAAKSLHIKVNPQYGAYSYAHFAVVPAVSMLSAVPGKAPASPGAGLTPHC